MFIGLWSDRRELESKSREGDTKKTRTKTQALYQEILIQ